MYPQFMMHRQENIKLWDAKQVYHYKNMSLKLYKNNAAIWFNKAHSSCVLTGHQELIESGGTICCICTTVSS